MGKITIETPVGGARPGDSIVVAFWRSRCNIGSLCVRAGGAQVSASVVQDDATRWRISLHESLPARQRVNVDWQESGEQARVRHLDWLPAGPQRDGEALRADEVEAREAGERSAATAFAQLLQVLEKRARGPNAGEDDAFRLFFVELDRKTYFPILDPILADGLRALSAFLKARIIRRAARQDPKFLELPSCLRLTVQAVESLLREQISQRLLERAPDEANAVLSRKERSRIARAFCSFAVGRLKVDPDLGPDLAGLPEWVFDRLGHSGVPDSAQYLCFAEIAILAHELGGDAESFWRDVMPILVESSELVFLLLTRLGSAKSCRNYVYDPDRPVPRISDERLERAVSACLDLGPDDAAERLDLIARDWFEDTVDKAGSLPFGCDDDGILAQCEAAGGDR